MTKARELLLRFGLLFVVLGFGSLLLQTFNMTFVLLSWLDDYQPVAGIIIGVIGVVMIVAGLLIKDSVKSQAAANNGQQVAQNQRPNGAPWQGQQPGGQQPPNGASWQGQQPGGQQPPNSAPWQGQQSGQQAAPGQSSPPQFGQRPGAPQQFNAPQSGQFPQPPQAPQAPRNN